MNYLNQRKKRILVIDEHPVILNTLSRVLQADYELVGECNGGEEGLALTQSLHPDLVMLELDLPRIDGLAVIRSLRAMRSDLRILVFSTNPARLMANHARAAGANGYVNKSCDMDELRSVVAAVLSGYDCFPSGSVQGRRHSAVPDQLSSREKEVLQHLTSGMANKDIAVRLGLSEKTVSTYKTRMFDKLGVPSLAALVEVATSKGLVDE